MLILDTAAFDNSTLVTPETKFKLDSVVDHPAAWLEVLAVFPCRNSVNLCLQADLASGQTLTAHLVGVPTQVQNTPAVTGCCPFKLAIQFDNLTGQSCLELGLSANADHVDVTLSLLDMDATLQSTPMLASGLALAMASILHTASRDVISTVHRALAPDLAETTVAFIISVPSTQFTPLLDAVFVELSRELQKDADPQATYRPAIMRRIADTALSVTAEPTTSERGQERTVLPTAQRLALALNLCALRESHGMSQLDVASQALGFTKSHASVSRLERGILPDVESERLALLASFFDTDVASLLTNRLTNGEPTLPGESTGLSPFDPNCDFTPSVNFGHRITLARTAAGLSISGLSRKLGHLADTTVQGWEQELTSPQRNSFIELGLALAAPVSWLMFGRRVDTPARGMALRLTAMQKLYGLSNGEVASLMEPVKDGASLQGATRAVHRLAVARNDPTTQALNSLATALQVPVEWIFPPSAKSAADQERFDKVRNLNSNNASISKTAMRLVTDLIDLIEMGVVTDSDIRTMRAEMITKYTTPYIRRMRPSATETAA